MGHKVHPYGFRIGINKPWLAKWYADRDYPILVQEDMRIRQLVAKQLSNASVSQVEIERGINHVTVTVHSAKPGIVIGKGGQNVELLRNSIGKQTDKKVKLEIKEVLQPELDAVLVAQNVAGQLERRIAFRKAVKQTVQRTIKAGAKGVKIQVSGRLGGAEMSRTEWDKEGRIPLGTLRADISYGVVHARTTYGRIGVKVWIYRVDRRAGRAGLGRRGGLTDATPQEGQAPQGPARAALRNGQGRRAGQLRRIRTDGRRGLLAHQPSDRGGAARDDPPHQAGGPDLDPRLPGQAGHQEAGRGADGLRQGCARPLGGGGEARTGDVRDVRRPRGDRPRGDAPGKPQAADPDEVRREGGGRAWTLTRFGTSPITCSRTRWWMRSRSSGRSASTSPRARRRTTAGCLRRASGSLAS